MHSSQHSRGVNKVFVRGWGSPLLQSPELAEWSEELEGKGDEPHWACSAVSLAAVQTKVFDTDH